tara:strand:- start:332 stop:754 length:423 start_codon:yes stop_codon:yes gene_type:complete
MKRQDIFYSTLAVILLCTIAYFAMSERVIVEEHVVTEIEIEERIVTETVTDTVWQYKDYRTSFLENEHDMLVSKNYLFTIARDNQFSNSIRDALPFSEVFGWWRSKLGPCGIFEWNGEHYTTLLKEEDVEEECYESTTSY